MTNNIDIISLIENNKTDFIYELWNNALYSENKYGHYSHKEKQTVKMDIANTKIEIELEPQVLFELEIANGDSNNPCKYEDEPANNSYSISLDFKFKGKRYHVFSEGEIINEDLCGGETEIFSDTELTVKEYS